MMLTKGVEIMPDTYKPMGTVSHGTMRAEDLIPAFAVELEYLTDNAIPNRAYVTTYDYRTANRELVNRANNLVDYESDTADFILEELFDALNEFAMSYFYFGAHPGDGADYGFWLNEDWEQCAKDDGVQFDYSYHNSTK
jgi:hypothetical protein|tara:strand:- start:4867 stop:5283 length:417 start_codon:yes stop_codon:yes gene_type:complete